MDREELRKQAKSRRQSAEVEEQKVAWECGFCSRAFATETGFMNHTCKAREKLEELQSPVGQTAYSYYAEWMRVRKMSVPPPANFLESRYYAAFIRFTKYSLRTAIPNVLQFIRVMVDHKMDPLMWMNPGVYTMYLEWFDNAYPPEHQFVESLDRVLLMAADLKCPPAEVFKELGSAKIIDLVKRRRLSPWLLVTSTKFIKWAMSLPADERELVSDCVGVAAYSIKLKEKPALTTMFKAATEEVGL